jgi:CDP-paratose 2-epimerase
MNRRSRVRDILYVEDLVNAFLLAQQHMPRLSGQAFNIGGGPANTVSLIELMALIETLHGQSPRVSLDRWRPGDQRYYVSDTRKFQNATGWSPRVSVEDGVSQLYHWLENTRTAAVVPSLKSASKPRSVSAARFITQETPS